MTKKLILGALVAILLGVGAVAAYDVLRGESALAYRFDRRSAGQPEMGASNRNYGERPIGEASRNLGLNQGTPAGVPEPQADVTEWITVQGTITAVELNALTIETVAGEMMAVQLGPEHYWTAQGIALAAGDEVEIVGFFEDGTSFNAGTVILLDTGDVLTLRDGDGRPLWAGGPGLRGNGGDGR